MQYDENILYGTLKFNPLISAPQGIPPTALRWTPAASELVHGLLQAQQFPDSCADTKWLVVEMDLAGEPQPQVRHSVEILASKIGSTCQSEWSDVSTSYMERSDVSSRFSEKSDSLLSLERSNIIPSFPVNTRSGPRPLHLGGHRALPEWASRL